MFVRVRQECGIFWSCHGNGDLAPDQLIMPGRERWSCHGNEWSREDRNDQATPMIAILIVV